MTKEECYIAAVREIAHRLERGGDLIADLGNVSAVLKKRLGFFWVGFYFLRGDHLVLGPFQGTPACVFLTLDKGVCAACATAGETIVVPDVHRFEGHVPCDPNSKSEIVVPLFDTSGTLRGVLDVDSDRIEGFGDTDQRYLEQIAQTIKTLWPTEPTE